MELLSPTDISRTQVDTFFARADEIVRGAQPNVGGTRAALALANLPFPLPLHTSQILDEARVQVITIAPTQDVDQLAREINSADATVVLFSHPEVGAALALADKVKPPVLNAGDGTNENPVRSLMDAFAIHTLKGNLEQARIAILGNLKFSAEAHSLARVLGMFGSQLSLVSPAALSMPYDLTDQVRLTAYEVEETNDLATTLRKTDALYLADIDAIRVDKKIYAKLKNFYSLAPETFNDSKEGLVVLGEWEGAQNLLASTRPHVERAARAMLLALVEMASS